MVDWVAIDLEHPYHARRKSSVNSKGDLLHQTYCGLTLGGRSGSCIAELIECERCRRIMRKEGWAIR